MEILSCKFAIPSVIPGRGAALPGGHIEAHEGLVESVIREVKEETGLTIKNPKLVGMKHFTRQMTSVILFSSIELQTLKVTFIRQKREKSVGLPGKMCLRWSWPMTCSTSCACLKRINSLNFSIVSVLKMTLSENFGKNMNYLFK